MEEKDGDDKQKKKNLPFAPLFLQKKLRFIYFLLLVTSLRSFSSSSFSKDFSLNDLFPISLSLFLSFSTPSIMTYPLIFQCIGVVEKLLHRGREKEAKREIRRGKSE